MRERIALSAGSAVLAASAIHPWFPAIVGGTAVVVWSVDRLTTRTNP